MAVAFLVFQLYYSDMERGFDQFRRSHENQWFDANTTRKLFYGIAFLLALSSGSFAVNGDFQSAAVALCICAGSTTMAKVTPSDSSNI